MNGDRSEGESVPQELGGKVVRGIGLAGGGFALAQAVNLLVYLVLARLISPEEFGVFAAATALFGFALLMTESGMMAALIHRDDRMPEAIASATLATLLGGLLFAAVCLAASPLVGWFFDSGEVATIAAVSSGMVFLRTAGVVPEALLQRQFSFVRRLVIEPSQICVFGIVSIVAASQGLGVWSLVIGQYAGFAVEAILSWTITHTGVQLRLASFKVWRELAAYGRHVLAATFILRAGEQADTVVVGRFLGTAALGQFRYAFRIASAPFQLLLAGAAYVLFPAFARISADPRRFRSAYLRSLGWLNIFAFPAGMVLVPLGVPLAVILFGEQWRPAGYLAMAMCLYTAAGTLMSIASEGFKAIGRPDALPKLHTVSTVATIAAMLALSPIGLTAVGAGFSLGSVVGAAYSLVLSRKLLDIPLSSVLQRTWAPALASLVMVAVVLPLELFVLKASERSEVVGLGLIGAEAILSALVYLALVRILIPAAGRPLFSLIRSLLAMAGRLVVRPLGRPAP